MVMNMDLFHINLELSLFHHRKWMNVNPFNLCAVGLHVVRSTLSHTSSFLKRHSETVNADLKNIQSLFLKNFF